MGKAARPAARRRHITSINDLELSEIGKIFSQAESFLRTLGDPSRKWRVGKSTETAKGAILATLFYEPSTRTRLSFESAMLRLGGKVISSADPTTSSAAKGESLADTVRIVENYADLLVIRHPRDGAARLAAEYAHVPVINAGDGAHEHPTQTLCDLFTLRRAHKTIRNLNVALTGDLKTSRTIHSFVYALARHGANILTMPAKGMELPEHVAWRLEHEFRSRLLPKAEQGEGFDAVYVTANRPHQLALIPTGKNIDVMYVTRFQKERWAEARGDYPTIDADFLKAEKYSHTSVLHPLPRVGELDTALDSDRRALYFQQAAYGIPVRMALIAALLGRARKNSLEKFPGGFRAERTPLYDQPTETGIRCANPNCIVHDAMERKYTRNKFHVIGGARLRCFYCETDILEFVAANRTSGEFTEQAPKSLKDTLFFASAADAQAAGFRPARKLAAHA